MAPSLAAAHDPPGAGVSTRPPRAATKQSRTSATDRMPTPAEQLPTTSTTSTTSRGGNSLTKLTNANVCASGLRLVSGYACEQKEPRPRHGDVDVGDVVGRQFASTRQMSDAGTATSNIIPRFDYTLAKKLLQEGKFSSEVVAAAERLGDHQLKRSIDRHIESLRGSHSLKNVLRRELGLWILR